MYRDDFKACTSTLSVLFRPLPSSRKMTLIFWEVAGAVTCINSCKTDILECYNLLLLVSMKNFYENYGSFSKW